MARLWATILIPALAGCQSPEAKTAQAARRADMEEFLEAFQCHSVDRSDNLTSLKEIDARSKARHARQLDEMMKDIEKAYRKDADAWRRNEPVRLERAKSIWDGKPSEIPKTFERMAN